MEFYRYPATRVLPFGPSRRRPIPEVLPITYCYLSEGSGLIAARNKRKEDVFALNLYEPFYRNLEQSPGDVDYVSVVKNPFSFRTILSRYEKGDHQQAGE